jgi:hypothetical protein
MWADEEERCLGREGRKDHRFDGIESHDAE